MSQSIEQLQNYLQAEKVYRVTFDRRLGQNPQIMFVEAVDEEDAKSTGLPGQRVVHVARAGAKDAEELLELMENE